MHSAPDPAGELLLANATLPDGRRASVHVAGGRIAAIEPAQQDGGDAATAPAVARIDLAGALLAPAFVDGHIHLDKVFIGVPWRPHVPQDTLAGRIAAERAALAEIDAEVPIAERAVALVRRAAAYGTGHLRTHVDVDTRHGLTRLEAVLEARERCRDLADVQIVAFPQSGVLSDPGTAALLDAAVRAGADVVGGLDPAGFDGDVEGQLGVVFDVAERHAARVDVHLHDAGTLGAFELRRIAHHTERRGLQGRVVVSHAYCLGELDPDDFGATAEALARAGVAILTNAPGGSPMPPVLRLRAAGVEVLAGTDNIRDAWWPYGTGDMLERAYMVGYRQSLFTDEELAVAFELATAAGARALGVEGYGLEVGARANLVAIDAPSLPEAVAAPPRRLLVLHDGRIVADAR